jgi:GMP synthase PP-ATPase subunit
MVFFMVLAQGTIYPDLSKPLRELLRNEVRKIDLRTGKTYDISSKSPATIEWK